MGSNGTWLADPATLWALLALSVGTLLMSWLAGAVVNRQSRWAMGLGLRDPMPWPHIDWPRLTGLAAAGTVAGLMAMAVAEVVGLDDVSRSLRMVVSTLVHFGLGTAIIGICTGFASRLPDEVDPTYRTLLVIGGTLIGVAAMSNMAVIALVAAIAIAVVMMGSVEDAQERAGALLSDVAAGMKLRARRLTHQHLDVGGLDMQIRSVGLLTTQVVEGDTQRAMRNELALALVGDPSE